MANGSESDSKPPTARQRRLIIGTGVLVQIIAVLAVVVMVNWLASRHYLRFDWTKSGYYKLSEKTKQVLVGLKEPVDVIVFLPPSDNRDYVEKILDDVRHLLAEFQFYGKNQLRVEFVDPQRDLGRARQLVEQYKLDSPDVIIFARGDRHKYVRLDDMVDLEADRTEIGGPQRVKAFKGEGVFLSAIQTVTEEQSPKVYFLSGHGERDPEDVSQREGYSEVARYIKRDNITVQQWNLLEKQALPADAGAIVIAGPRKPFAETELAALDQYLKNKGRLFVMLDPRTETGLESWLQRWGAQADNDLVVAKGGLLLGTELIVVNALGSTYAAHPITANLEGINTVFPYARSVHRVVQVPGENANQPRVTELVKTPAAFWGETESDTARTEFNAAQDIKGPLTLAVAVETSKPKGVDVSIGVTRLVLVGTSRFVDNNSLSGGNLDFFMNSLNWLLQREQLVAVGPKMPQEFSLDMSLPQQRAVYALVIGGLPLAVAIIGLAVWLRRRA
jgi:ABC-type uncharacterized transport system involved in gliding motility auxiliary subunit